MRLLETVIYYIFIGLDKVIPQQSIAKYLFETKEKNNILHLYAALDHFYNIMDMKIK